MPHRSPTLDHVRERYAAEIARAAWVTNPRVERAFATLPREGFLPPPPWTVFAPGEGVMRETNDPADLYHDVLVVLDRRRGINNGQPSLHAAWLAALDPQPGDSAVHVGAGTGYYTALLAFLVSPGGRVEAFEIEARLAEAAARNLAAFSKVRVHPASALGAGLAASDLVYVNAALAAPDPAWLGALKPGGRLIMPWQPAPDLGVTLLVTRLAGGFRAEPGTGVAFITCAGPRAAHARVEPGGVAATRSVWLRGDRNPDGTATVIADEVWFSSAPIPADA